MSRQFIISDAQRQSVPLLIGLMGPSGGGKTYTALRLATGVQKVFPGDILFIDTESRRALHYADQFTFKHIPFGAPFGSLDYLEVLNFAAQQKPSVVIVDSFSHEHEGPGGLLDLHEQELDRMAGNDFAKRERMKMLAWSKPKQQRRKLINGLLQMDSNFIFCFRAKESSRPAKDKRTGKTIVENFGFMPIAGDEFVFEMTINCLLLPHANGVPSWQSDNRGERMMMKLPEQFKPIFDREGIQLDESIGERLAKWAKGGEKAAPTPKADPVNQEDVEELAVILEQYANNVSDDPRKFDIIAWFGGQPANVMRNAISRLKQIEDATGVQKAVGYLQLYSEHPKVQAYKSPESGVALTDHIQQVISGTDAKAVVEAVATCHKVIGG